MPRQSWTALSTRRSARRSIASSQARTASFSSRTALCAATMPTMPATSPRQRAIFCRSFSRWAGSLPRGRTASTSSRLATEAIGLLEATARAQGVTIVSEPSRQMPAHGDTRGVIQILVNLLGNAVRHSPNGGTVTITFDRSDGFARAHVTDQGPGHCARGPAAHLRTLRASQGRRRRNRARPRDRPAPRSLDGRRHHSRKRAGAGRPLHDFPARGLIFRISSGDRPARSRAASRPYRAGAAVRSSARGRRSSRSTGRPSRRSAQAQTEP